jgi:hypothetical protein
MPLSYLGLSCGPVNADRLPVAAAGGDDLRVCDRGLVPLVTDDRVDLGSPSRTAARSSMTHGIALRPSATGAAIGSTLKAFRKRIFVSILSALVMSPRFDHDGRRANNK